MKLKWKRLTELVNWTNAILIYIIIMKKQINFWRKLTSIQNKMCLSVMVKSYISFKMISFQCHVYTLSKINRNVWSTMGIIAILKNLTIAKGKLVTNIFVQVEKYPVLLYKVTSYCEHDWLKYCPCILPFQCIQTLLN